MTRFFTITVLALFATPVCLALAAYGWLSLRFAPPPVVAEG